MRQPPPVDAVVRVIPGHWTPEQALAAWECLRAVQDALWTLYGPQMQQAWRETLDSDGPADPIDPENPQPDWDADAPF